MMQSYKEKMICQSPQNCLSLHFNSKGMTEEQYINFDDYIRQGEPQKKARADAWRVAIGLQAVDGLKTSACLFGAFLP